MSENFCDFCPCQNCKHGDEYLSHCKTVDGKWICSICWTYDLCTSNDNPFGAIRSKNGPCPNNQQCEHRPQLVGNWQAFNPNKVYV